jgi:HEAT repeat protein
VVLLGKFPKREPPRRSRPKRAPGEVSVDELIARLGERHDADVAAGLADLQADLPGSEQMLWDAVRQAEGKRRLGAARLLARIGTHRSLGVLIELAGDSLTHEAAVLGLARLAAAPEVARLAASEPDPRLRQHLLAGLLARRTSESTGYYLGLVQQPRTRSDALAAVVAMDDPPAEMLLDYLDSPQSSLRLAAAQALSRLADPAVAERLCQSLGGIGRQEALMALLLSSSDQAADCLRHARQNIYLMAAVQAAEQQLYSLDLQRGGNLP